LNHGPGAADRVIHVLWRACGIARSRQQCARRSSVWTARRRELLPKNWTLEQVNFSGYPCRQKTENKDGKDGEETSYFAGSEGSRGACRGRPAIYNSDQGAQFTSDVYTAALTEAGVAISMDGRRRWINNVFVERLWRTVK